MDFVDFWKDVGHVFKTIGVFALHCVENLPKIIKVEPVVEKETPLLVSDVGALIDATGKLVLGAATDAKPILSAFSTFCTTAMAAIENPVNISADSAALAAAEGLYAAIKNDPQLATDFLSNLHAVIVAYDDTASEIKTALTALESAVEN